MRTFILTFIYIQEKNIIPDDEISSNENSSDESDNLNSRIRKLAQFAKFYELERKKSLKCETFLDG